MMAGQNLVAVLALLCTVEGVRSAENSLIVNTRNGAVKGITQLTPTGKTVDAWYGIPYAQPPIGDLRFRHPRLVQDWNETKDTTELPNSCVQITDTFFGDFEGATMWNPNTPMSEDCLYLTVVVPRPRKKNRAVLVWIYGGSFLSGSSTLDIYDYKTLASEQDIILVAPQYRVGSLGFLYMGTSDVPGNTGLFDQLMALQWIHDNIEAFGGNKDNITLFGESAGAASVSMHLLSPLSQKFFSQAIMQSGSATASWGTVDKEEAILRALSMAQALECPHSRDNMTEVVECLKTVNASSLVTNDPITNICEFPFVPIIDGTFFVESPIKSLRSGNFKKTNLIMGSNADEGYYFVMYYLDQLFKRVENVTVSREDFKTSVKTLHPYFDTLAEEAILYEYTNWVNPDDVHANREAIDKIIGDHYFTCNVNEFAYYYALAGNNVYMYYFTHRSSQNKWPKWAGVLHGDEIDYLFGQPLNPRKRFTRQEQELSRNMMRYWANFARSGKPTEGTDGTWTTAYWPPHSVIGREYLELNVNHTKTGRGPRLKKCAFWKKFLPKLIHYSDKSRSKGPEQCPRESIKSSANSLLSQRVTAMVLVAVLAVAWQ